MHGTHGSFRRKECEDAAKKKMNFAKKKPQAKP
jgi:hypothetical protein